MDMTLLQNFARNLKDAMEEKGLSQQDVARNSGVHWVTISKLLSGRKKDASIATLEKIAQGAGIRPDTIFLTPVEIQS